MSDWEEDDSTPAFGQQPTGSTSKSFGTASGDSHGFGFDNLKINDDHNNTGFGDKSSSFGGFESSNDSRGRGRGRGRGAGGRGGACFKCQQEGHRASDCPNGDASGGDSFFGSGGGSQRGGGDRPRRGRGCFKCHKEGHRANECPNGESEGGDSFNFFGGGNDNKRNGSDFGDRPSRGRGCFKCHKEGHRANECPNGESEGGDSFNFFGGGDDNKRDGSGFGDRPSRGRACFKCHQEGHRAAECTNEESSGGFGGGEQRKKGCFKCGEEGHMSRECTNDPVRKEGELGEDGKPRPPLYIPVDLDDEHLASQGIEAGINFDNYGNIPIKVSGDGNIPSAINDFGAMNIRKLLEDNIAKANYKKPTPIQSIAVPVLMAGRDIMGCAQTGSGKTIAYLLPILNYILKEGCDSHAMEESAKPTGLVLCPTRELALQIYYEARKLGLGSTALHRVAYGGTAVFHQLKNIQAGCHLLVGTIGRIMDFIEKGKLRFDDLKFLVLDEADRMLSMGFKQDLEKILSHSSMPSAEQRQTLMFSATFATEIQTLASSFMHNYVFVVVGTVGAANTDVTQEIMEVEKVQKRDILIQHIRDMQTVEENLKVLVFVETKKMADFVGAYLCNNEIKATTIHGDRFQSQREEALETFRRGDFNVLVATAVAARGLDIRGVGCVINYDLPKEVDEYVHRIGRTGRVGNSGYALSFYDSGSDGALAKDLLKILSEANQTVPEWLKTAADSSSYTQGYFGSGKYASADVRKNVNTIDEDRSWGGDALGGPAPAAAVDDDDWDA